MDDRRILRFPFHSLFFFPFIISFSLALKTKKDPPRPHARSSQVMATGRSDDPERGRGSGPAALLTGHSHHVVGFGGAGPAHHHQFLLAADVAVHHGARGAAPRGGHRDGDGRRRRRGDGGRGLVQDADGAVLADAVGHLVRVHPERELAGQKEVQLLDGQADALAGLPHQGVHLVVDADAAVA